jgi:phage-related protein
MYTKKQYTNESQSDNFRSSAKAQGKLAEIIWEPGTHEALCGFPGAAKKHLGYHLWLVQKGEVPPDSSPVPGIPGVFELRDEDARAWYRVIYLKKTDGKIYVIHCFEKRSNHIEKRDIRTIQIRLRKLNERLTKERHHGSHTEETQ